MNSLPGVAAGCHAAATHIPPFVPSLEGYLRRPQDVTSSGELSPGTTDQHWSLKNDQDLKWYNGSDDECFRRSLSQPINTNLEYNATLSSTFDSRFLSSQRTAYNPRDDIPYQYNSFDFSDSYTPHTPSLSTQSLNEHVMNRPNHENVSGYHLYRQFMAPVRESYSPSSPTCTTNHRTFANYQSYRHEAFSPYFNSPLDINVYLGQQLLRTTPEFNPFVTNHIVQQSIIDNRFSPEINHSFDTAQQSSTYNQLLTSESCTRNVSQTNHQSLDEHAYWYKRSYPSVANIKQFESTVNTQFNVNATVPHGMFQSLSWPNNSLSLLKFS